MSSGIAYQSAEGVGYSYAPAAEDLEWQLQSNCTGMSDHFYSRHIADIRMAKRVCAECPVIAQCRSWALEKHEQHGVWGGLSEQEREDRWRGRRRGRPPLSRS